MGQFYSGENLIFPKEMPYSASFTQCFRMLSGRRHVLPGCSAGKPLCSQISRRTSVKANGIAPMQHTASEVLQIVPDSIWRSVSYPSVPEGVLNLSPSLLSCSWSNSY